MSAMTMKYHFFTETFIQDVANKQRVQKQDIYEMCLEYFPRHMLLYRSNMGYFQFKR